MDKPNWAGPPGPPGGGDDDDPTGTYVLNIEIDYMVGHEPTLSVLAYIVSYYDAKGIDVTFYFNDGLYSNMVTDPTPGTGVTDEDFWSIEASYNDNGYFDNWKWVLFGTTVVGQPSIMGYTWVMMS